MKLDYAFFAIGANVSRDARLNVTGGEIGGVSFAAFPTAAEPLFLVMRVVSPKEAVGAEHTLTLHFRERGSDIDIAPSHHE
ncbi:MAG TPA: hypothetical protein VGH32_00175, partial [Pirellulales bacterium]